MYILLSCNPISKKIAMVHLFEDQHLLALLVVSWKRLGQTRMIRLLLHLYFVSSC